MRWAVLIGILSALWIDAVVGQATSNVTCSASTSWMTNALNQNPCLVSAYLSGACDGGDWTVPTLSYGSEGPYNPPQNDALNSPNTTGATVCRCNTAVYNLLQACSVCQGGIIGTWGDWIEFCPSQNVNKGFPVAVPGGTIIPGWATLDPTITGTWNATQAETYAATHATGTGTASADPSSTSAPASSSSGHKSNAGAIAGGVVGGVIGLLLLALAIFFCLRYRRNRESKGEKVTPVSYGTSSPGIDQPYHHNGGYVEKTGPNRMDLGTPAPFMGGLHSGSPFSEGTPRATGPMRPYDPSDPSTFPTSPAPTSHTYVSHNPDTSMGSEYGYGGQQHQQTYPPYHPGSPQPFAMQHSAAGTYTGAAEV